MFTSSPFDFFQQASTYWMDATQRQILLWETLHKRSQNFSNEVNNDRPNVLTFKTETLVDGRKATPAVNYLLERVLPPNGQMIDNSKRPIIIFDPRAAQGAGMAGMKPESQIGSSLKNGHPTYYVSFFTLPEDGQTIEHICDLCLEFVQTVIERHPDGPRPLLIGNCQAGWQIALMHALKPELDCQLMLAAAPLSFWSGSHGENPMRYTSGMTGGSWPVALASDLGGGYFDSAYLIDNFEKNSPHIAYWQKLYDLYCSVDTSADRYLNFERWWNSPVLFRDEEIRFIVERLFIGNELANSTMVFDDGRKADLKSIKSPIFHFCSAKDVITPLPQALGWVLDCYKTDEEIVENEQVLIYRTDHSAGHLGLIVSHTVVEDTYQKLFDEGKTIDKLAPGIYEAIDAPVGAHGFHFEKRSINDIHELCPKDKSDEACFKNVVMLSKILRTAYDFFAAPMIKSMVTPELAEMTRAMHPVRSRLTAICDQNPFVATLPYLAAWAKEHRETSPKTSVFWQAQEASSYYMTTQIDLMNKQKDNTVDELFSLLYGSAWSQ